jgi:hypothetical protein
MTVPELIFAFERDARGLGMMRILVKVSAAPEASASPWLILTLGSTIDPLNLDKKNTTQSFRVFLAIGANSDQNSELYLV